MTSEKEIKGPVSESISHWGAFEYKIGKREERKPLAHPSIDAVECPIAKQVALQVAERAHVGMKKYGVTMMRPDYTTIQTIKNAIEEALDLAVYLTRVVHDMENKDLTNAK